MISVVANKIRTLLFFDSAIVCVIFPRDILVPFMPNAIDIRVNLRGCTGDFSKKKIFSNTFISQRKLVDMACRMKSHQSRFQKKSFSCVLCAFFRVFSCLAGKNAFLDGFHVVFTVVRPFVWLLYPPFCTGTSGHPS